MTVLLVSGLPGAGKSTFASWLAGHRGYVAIDTDKQPEWFARLAVNDRTEAETTFELLRTMGEDVVVEWGFLPKALGSVRLLRDAGVEAWWFTGDLAATRASFQRRTGGTDVAMRMYEAQLSRIEAALPRIEEFYGERIVRTVAEGPTFERPESLASTILQEDR